MHSRIASVKSWFDRRFFRSVTTLAAGSTLGLLIPLLFSPLLTRLYTPYEFGLLALFVAWLSNIVVVIGGRYELAIILPTRQQDAVNLLALALTICTVLSVLLWLPVVFLRHWITLYVGAPELSGWLLLLPLSVWCAGAAQIWVNWNNRLQRYQATARGRVAQALVANIVQLCGGLAGLGIAALIVGQTLAQAVALWAYCVDGVRSRFRRGIAIRASRMWTLARQYSEFPVVNAPHAFFWALQDAALLWLLSWLCGAAVVGWYGLVVRVSKAPASIIAQAVSQVIYREFADAYRQGGQLLPMLLRVVSLLAIVALLPFGLLMLMGDSLFGWVFGENWRVAGQICAILSPSFFWAFVSAPCTIVPMVLKQQRLSLFFMLSWTALNMVISATILFIWRDFMLAFKAISLCVSGYLITYIVWVCLCCDRIDSSRRSGPDGYR